MTFCKHRVGQTIIDTFNGKDMATFLCILPDTNIFFLGQYTNIARHKYYNKQILSDTNIVRHIVARHKYCQTQMLLDTNIVRHKCCQTQILSDTNVVRHKCC